MKKRFNLKNSIGKKNLLLTVVALVLVMLMVVGVSYSWIEQISNVEMTLGGEKSPMHISTDRLNKPAEAKINTTDLETEQIIDLSKYFYESGNMHLSSCYSDSKSFYFPKKSNNGTNNVPTYRLGTKSDANVNYISVSFKLENTEDYEQAYWFDNNATLFSTGDTTLNKYIRCSMTIDGATSIFSAADTPKYKTVSGISASSVSETDCQSFKAYQYDASHNNENDSGNNNLSPTRGANGNVLFTLPAQKTSMVTIKVWLEYDGSNRTATLADVDLKLVSSFAKTRRVYINDECLYGNASSTWLRSDGAKLYFAVLKEHYSNNAVDYYLVENKWQLKKSGGSTTYTATDKNFYIDIPAYYNNWKAVLMRCSDSGYAQGNLDVEYGDKKVKYNNNGTDTQVKSWNCWETALPDTFDNRSFTVYTPEFGSWSSKVHHFYYVDSWRWGDADGETEEAHNIKLYMWDNRTATGQAGSSSKVIENHTYPGKSMFWASGHNATYTNSSNVTTTISNGRIGGNDGTRIYKAFFDTDYTHVVFSKKNSDYKTGDLSIPDDIDDHEYYYDLRSGRWIADDLTQICYKASNTWVFGNNYGSTPAKQEQFYYSDASSTIQYATKFLSAGTKYNFQVLDTYGSDHYYKPEHNNYIYKYSFSPDTTEKFYDNNTNYFMNIKESDNEGAKYTGMYTIKWDADTNQHVLSIRYPENVNPGTASGGSGSGGSGSGSGSSGTSSMGNYTINSGFTVQLRGQTYTAYKNSSSGTKMRVQLPLSAGENWVTFQKDSNNYGLNASGQSYDVPRDDGLNVYLVRYTSNNISLRNTSSAGNYIVMFEYNNGDANSDTIKLTGVVAASS